MLPVRAAGLFRAAALVSVVLGALLGLVALVIGLGVAPAVRLIVK